MKTIWNLPTIRFMPFAEIEDERAALLVTSSPAWNAVKDRLGGMKFAAQVEVLEATTAHWDSLLVAVNIRSFDVVYSVGGGLTADAGKYISAKLNLPLTVIPTALSVDAFITAASGIRRGGCVSYIDTQVPGNVILDLDMIASAPPALRAAGITDVMSIATGSWDWQFADREGMNPPGMEFIPWVHANAQSILSGVLDCAEAAGLGDREGLKTLYDCLAMEVQLCNQIGHARPEEGSEHYFAYCVEQFAGPGWPHADLLGPGILLMAKRQGQDCAPLKAAMEACHIPLERLGKEETAQALIELPAYCRKHQLPYGIAHELEVKE